MGEPSTRRLIAQSSFGPFEVTSDADNAPSTTEPNHGAECNNGNPVEDGVPSTPCTGCDTGREQAASITGLNAEILGLKATLKSAQDRLRESASLVQEFAFGIGDRDEKIAQLTDLPSTEMREVPGISMPDDCTFAYTVCSEAWYSEVLKDTGVMKNRPELMVAASGNGGGCKWEFSVVEKNLGGPTVQVRMFGDSFDAYVSIPAFFSALEREQPSTLDEVRQILDDLGAIDQTQREEPRLVSPLPDKPGQQGTARVRDIRRFVVRSAQEQEPVWFLPSATNPEDAWASSAELSDYQDGVL